MTAATGHLTVAVRFPVIFFLAVLAAGPIATAQVDLSDDLVEAPASPVFAGYYDLQTGQTLHEAPPGVPVCIFDNTAPSGFMFFPGHGNWPGAAFMDWGTLQTGKDHNPVDRMQIAYCTNRASPTITMYLHEGATGFGNPGASILAITLVDLPGSIFGGVECQVVEIVGLQGIQLNTPSGQGPIGWSYEFVNSNQIWPLLVGPPVESGVMDAFDVYTDSFSSYEGTFFFGSEPFASLYLKLIQEQEPECFLVIGDGTGEGGFAPGIHEWTTQVGTIQDS